MEPISIMGPYGACLYPKAGQGANDHYGPLHSDSAADTMLITARWLRRRLPL